MWLVVGSLMAYFHVVMGWFLSASLEPKWPWATGSNPRTNLIKKKKKEWA